MTLPRILAALALAWPLAPVAACPWHGGAFGDPGAFLAEPVDGGQTDLQPAQAAQPAPSREELMARQRELFLARYPQLAADGAGKPVASGAPAAPPTGNF
jgi:hypothetical protein